MATPGPLTPIDPAAYDLALPPVVVSLEEQALERELAELLEASGAQLDGVAGLLTGDWRGELEQLHADAAAGIHQDLDCGDAAALATATVVAEEVDALSYGTLVAIPGEAFEDVGPFFALDPDSSVPPPYTTPEVPPPEPTPPPTAPTPPPGPPPPQVRIVNRVRGGSVAFWVGDRWEVTVTGAANAPVVIQAWHNGSPLWPVEVGRTDAGGTFHMAGVMDEPERGVWIEEWWVGGVLAEPTLTFTVY